MNRLLVRIKRALTDQRRGNAGSPLRHCGAVELERKSTNEGGNECKPVIMTNVHQYTTIQEHSISIVVT